MNRPPSAESAENSGRERRTWSRYATSDVDIHVHLPTGDLSGTLVDESIGGLGFCVTDVSQLAFGQDVQFTLRDSRGWGTIRAIRRESSERFRVSISRSSETGESSCPVRKDFAHYVSHGTLLLVCELLFSDDQIRKKVRLWNGATFQVPAELISSRSYDVRRSELYRLHSTLETIAKLYGQTPATDEEQLIQQILNYEFQASNREWMVPTA